jgi:2-keto-4-pentenoate hydratase/2-oxohepta-3-ene-1,7-dioic acid hydratase in catechol pathway
MKLYSFENAGVIRVGAEIPGTGKLVDLAVAHEARWKASGRTEAALPADMLGLIRGGEAALRSARQALELAVAKPELVTRLDLASVKLRAPIPRPNKILCSGINYHGHFQENPKAKFPEEPFFFSKLPSAVVGPGEPIVLPAMSKQVDYEVEMAVVIGQPLARASEAAVPGAIFGYSLLHDVSARDVQFKDSQITLGKNFDSFSPIGPCIVTADEIPHPEKLKLRTLLNGEVMQDSSNEDWVFPLPRLLSFLSQVTTLEPGDVVSTGTPRGVGYFRSPQVFLKAGDRVAIESDSIGRLENPVVAAR